MTRKLLGSFVVAMLVGVLLAMTPTPPAEAAVLPPVFSLAWGTGGTGNGQFDRAVGVAYDSSGNVYVADRLNNRIQKFTANGGYLAQWGGAGTGNGDLNWPRDVAVDGNGNVYVADTGNDRIQKFTANGGYLAQWGTQGTGNRQFNGPWGVAVDTTGNIYVADTGNDRVQKLSSTGAYLDQWGSTGSGTGQFQQPSDVTAAGGAVYVADSSNNRIQKFSATGTHQGTFGTNGTGNGQFSNPLDVDVDASGNLYVADTANNRIQVLSSAGAYLTQWGSFGTDTGRFNTPRAVSVDPNGTVYVADRDNDRIQKFVPAAPALTVGVTADETTVVAGAVIHYHVTITNTGNTALTGVTVTDARAPACAGTVADVAVGASRTVNCSYTTTLSDIGSYANTATVATNETTAVTSSAANVTVTASAQTAPPPVFVRSWGGLGSANGQLVQPEGVAVDSSGSVYVADTYNNRIQKFTAEGTFVTKWGSSGTGNGQFNLPFSVAVDASDNVYVSDLNNHRIQKFSSAGTFLTAWGGNGTGNGQFSYPWGVTVDGSGNVYVADTYNNRIQKFSSSGTYLAQWGGAGSGDGQFVSPTRVAVDAAGNVYVLDSGNHRVQKFTSGGAFVTKWGNHGTADGQFTSPYGVAVDGTGNVYVTDNTNRIQEFTSTGTFVTKWGAAGTAIGQFNTPTEIDVGPSGSLYVVDYGNHRIQQFAPSVIRGTVTQSLDGGALAGTWVAALRSSDYQLVGGTTTDASGQYALPVTPGSYRLEFIEPQFRHDLEFYDNKPYDQLATSTPVTATLGAATTGINAALYLPTGVIAGRVLDSTTGTGMANAGVAVMSTSDYHPYAAVFSAANGSYRLTGLPPGEYWVVAATPDGTHQPTFIGGTHTPQGASRLTVTADHTTTGADITLAPVTDGTPTAVLQGTLTDKVNGLVEPGVLVAALRAADFNFTVAGFTDANGHYQLTVPTGNYYLEFFDLDHGHEFEWYREQPHPTDPGQLTVVTAPGTANEHLIPLTGTAAGTVTDAGTGLAGVWVAVLSSTDGHGVAGTTTAADGTWTIPGLNVGPYFVVYLDPTGRHALEFHDNTPNISTATAISITGSHTTTISAGLAPTG